MAIQSSLKNMATVLTAVCLVCSALLAFTYAMTFSSIESASRKSLQNALGDVLPSDGEIDINPRTLTFEGTEYEYYVQTAGGKTVAWAVKSVTSGFGGSLSVLVGITSDGEVCSTKVLSHSETPGLGAKCQTDTAFMGQFRHFNPASSRLAVKKDGGDIDAITASTITSRAYTLAVANAVKLLPELQKNCDNE